MTITKKRRLSPAGVRRKLVAIEQQIKELENLAVEIRFRCSHNGSLSRESDPSGNNDTGYYCSACLRCFDRRPE